jgi:hypothetical protein
VPPGVPTVDTGPRPLSEAIKSPDASRIIEFVADADDDDRRRRVLRNHHWTMLAMSVAVLGLSFALQIDGSGSVATGWSQRLPIACGSRALFDVDCPGCGLTRSFVALAHGDVRQSLAFHRVGFVLAAVVVLQLVYRPWALYELRTKIVHHRWPHWVGYGLIGLLIVNWLMKMGQAQ